VAKIQHGFAALGPQGLVIFKQLIEAIQKSLSTAITSVFFLGFILMVLGFISVLFLREIPLRKSHTDPVADIGNGASPASSEEIAPDASDTLSAEADSLIGL